MLRITNSKLARKSENKQIKLHCKFPSDKDWGNKNTTKANEFSQSQSQSPDQHGLTRFNHQLSDQQGALYITFEPILIGLSPKFEIFPKTSWNNTTNFSKRVKTTTAPNFMKKTCWIQLKQTNRSSIQEGRAELKQ